MLFSFLYFIFDLEHVINSFSIKPSMSTEDYYFLLYSVLCRCLVCFLPNFRLMHARKYSEKPLRSVMKGLSFLSSTQETAL